MARKIKIPNHILKRHARAEEKRKINVRNKRMYYLIVCEGGATEPNYFEGLKQDLPKGILTAYQIDIAGAGRNTESLVDEALKLQGIYEKENFRAVDRLWVVFDKDSFAANDFNNAIIRCIYNNPAIGCAWSNEAFEFWYLLHFHYYQNAMSRQQYRALIEQNLKPHVGEDYIYQKNSKEMYALLKQFGSTENAINNAKALVATYGERQDYAEHNPCTMVWKLVEELLQLKD
jgi:hypothetical protein